MHPWPRALPLQPLPRPGSRPAGGAGNSPVCRRAGGGAGAGGRAGRGVERARFTGPGGSLLRGGGAGPLARGEPGYPPGVGAGRGAPRRGPGGVRLCFLPAQALARRSCVWVCFSPTKKDRAREGGKVEGTRGGGGEGERAAKRWTEPISGGRRKMKANGAQPAPRGRVQTSPGAASPPAAAGIARWGHRESLF